MSTPLVAASTVKDSLEHVRRYVDGNLAGGVDHLVVFLDAPSDEGQGEVLTHLEQHPVRSGARRVPDHLGEQRTGDPVPARSLGDPDALQLGDVPGVRRHGVAHRLPVTLGHQVRHRRQGAEHALADQARAPGVVPLGLGLEARDDLDIGGGGCADHETRFVLCGATASGRRR